MCHYDEYQIDKDLMVWAQDKSELLHKSKELIGKKVDTSVLDTMSVDVEKLVKEILA